MKQRETETDWTEQEPGHSNSSDRFEFMAQIVAMLIRGSAHDIVNGNIEKLAVLLLAQLSHRYGFTTPKTLAELHRAWSEDR